MLRNSKAQSNMEAKMRRRVVNRKKMKKNKIPMRIKDNNTVI